MSTYFSPHTLHVCSTGSSLPNAPISTPTLLSALSRWASPRSLRFAKSVANKLNIQSRHFSRDLDRPTSSASPSAPDLCKQALISALENLGNSNKSHHNLDYLIGHTASPHTLMPPNIAWTAEKLHHKMPYMELRQACTGFANALQIAAPMLTSDTNLKTIGIIGSETGSVYFNAEKNANDRAQLINYVQMGDGAGAIILANSRDQSTALISDIYTGHIGLGQDSGFYLDGGSRHPIVHDENTLHTFSHNAQAIAKNGIALFEKGVESILGRGYTLNDFDFILPHQANGRMDAHISKYFSIPKEKIINNAPEVGNLGSAAIWYSFDKLRRSNKLSKGQKLLVLGAEATKYLYGGFVYTH